MIKRLLGTITGTKKPYIHNGVKWLTVAGYMEY